VIFILVNDALCLREMSCEGNSVVHDITKVRGGVSRIRERMDGDHT
jgi:hypothetical protein